MINIDMSGKQSNTRSSHNIFRFKILFFFFTIIAIITCFIIMRMEYRNYVQSIDTVSRGTVYIYQQHMLRMLEAADLILLQTGTYLQNKNLLSVDNSKEVWEYLVKLSNKIPQIRSIWIADANGKMLVYSGKYPTPVLDVSDRDYFINSLPLKEDSYYLGPPIPGKYTGKPFFSMSHAIRNSQGDFKGVIVAAIEPEYLSVFKDLSLEGILFRISLVSQNGVLFSEYPEREKTDEDETDNIIESFLSKKKEYIMQGSFWEGKISALHRRQLGENSFLVISECGTDNIFASLWPNWSLGVVPITVVYMLITVLFVFLMKKMKREEEARLEAEKALSESEERLRRLGDNMPNGSLYQMKVSPSGERSFCYITAGVEKIFHIPATQVLANPKILYDIIHPEDKDKFLKTEEEAIKNLKIFEIFSRFKLNNNEQKWIQIRSIPHIEEDKTVTWDGFFVDMTKEHELELELRHIQKMDSIGQLAGGVAHDFNNMLAGIIGCTELLERMKLPKETEQFLQLILKSATRASTLTQQLLTFSRKVDHPMVTLDFHQVIKDSIALLERSINRNIELRLELNADKNCVRGDAGLLQSVVMNLSINARDAMDEGGVITYQTSDVTLTEEEINKAGYEICSGDYIKLVVSDTGKGIESSVLPMIFDPFFSTKEVGKGTGLGLSVTYGVIRKYNGNISVNSEKGKGTSFTILLPIDSALSLCDNSAVKKVNFTLEDVTILVVEDEDTVRGTIEMLIKYFGCNVITAENGIEGLDLFKENQESINLVVLDLIMPKMSGIEVFEKIREISPKLPVILCSGYSSDHSINEFLKNDNVYFMEKPFMQEDFKNIIIKALKAV